MVNKHNQQGFSLFMVMIMMIVIALLVVITSQTTSTESRLSANEADRKYALSEAEVGLREAENFLNNDVYEVIKTDPTTGVAGKPGGFKFTENCTKGLCAPVEKVELVRTADVQHFEVINSGSGINTPAWERANAFSASSSMESSNKKSRYIVEYMGQREDKSNGVIHDYFRVTSRAHGENPNTVVTLQSYVEMTRKD